MSKFRTTWRKGMEYCKTGVVQFVVSGKKALCVIPSVQSVFMF